MSFPDSRTWLEQTNISTTEVQQFDAAAKLSGQTFEDLQAPLSKLAGARKDAAEGNEDLRRTFQRLGVSLDDLNNPALTNIDLMRQIAERVRALGSSAREASDFRDLFGRSGEKVAAIFKDLGNAKITPISPEDVRAIAEANDQLEIFKTRWDALGAKNLGRLAEAVNPESKLTPLQRIGRFFTTRPLPQDWFQKEATAENPRPRSAEMVGPMPLGPSPYEDKARERLQKEILEQEARLHERIFKLQLDQMGVSEQRAALEAKIKEHIKAAADARDFGQDKLANEQLEKALELQGELGALDKKPTGEHKLHLTELEQKGLLLGGAKAFALQGAGDDSPRRTAQNTEEMKKTIREVLFEMKRGNTSGNNGGPSF